MKKSVLAIALAVLMAVSLLTVGAMAENANGAELPASENGVIKLVEDVITDKSYTVSSNITIDLAGHRLVHSDVYGTSGVFFNVKAGRLTIIDSVGGGELVVNEQYRGNNYTGTELNHAYRCIQVYAGAEFVLESGTIVNNNPDYGASATINNYGTTTINGGTVKGVTAIFSFAPSLGGVTGWENEVATLNINDGSIIGVACTTAIDTRNIGSSYGVCTYGPGLDNGMVDNTKSIININGGYIEAIQGVATNASGGVYAGYTLNMIDGTINGTEDGTGMYLPAIGINNISGGTITGAQGIRICAGKLNITGGTVTSMALSDDSDLVAGGSGGTNGAIVVGKASGGYVGDIDVNISGTAVIENTATGDGTKPAIVVSDKNMSDASMGYDALSISVDVTGGEVKGDIVKISNLENTSTQDGGNTALNLDGATVDGNVINQTSAGGVFINNSQVTGTVSATTEENSVTIIGSDVGLTSGKNVSVVNSTVNGEPVTNVGTAVASVNGVTYDSLTEALALAKAGNTVYLLNNVEIDAPLVIPAGVTLDGNDFTIEASEAFSGSYLINLNNGNLSDVKIMDVVLDGNNKASILLKVGDGAVCSGLTVSGVTFKNATHGVYLGNDSGSQNAANNISFTDCTFEDLSYAGIYAQRGNIAVDQCKFQNIASASSTAAGVLFDTGYFDSSAYSLSVTNSTFTNITGTSSNEKATGGVSITGTGTVSKLTVTGNTFSGNTIDIRLGKTTAPVISDANIAGNGIVNIVAAPGVGLYTAKFYSNNALVATVVSDETGKITIPAAPSNSGYIFLGWRSGDATYKAGEVVTVNSDTTFTAVWGNLPDVKPSEPSEPETPVFPFYDVSARDWYYSAVKYVYEKGLMDGVDVGVFAPNDTLTRAMVWTIIARAEGVDTTGGATWYAKAQEWVTAKGISDGENPNAAITRQELVTMLYRLAGEPAVSGTITAPDAASVSTWATNAMTWAMNIGLVEGDENGAVTPTATATRAQAAALIMRYLEA